MREVLHPAQPALPPVFTSASTRPMTEIKIPAIEAKCRKQLSVAWSRSEDGLQRRLRWMKNFAHVKSASPNFLSLAPVRKVRRLCRHGPDIKRLEKTPRDTAVRRKPASALISAKGLPRINNVVDVINLASVEKPAAHPALRLANVEGAVEFRAGRAGETYKNWKVRFELESLPLFADARGPHGKRDKRFRTTMVTDATTRSWRSSYRLAERQRSTHRSNA